MWLLFALTIVGCALTEAGGKVVTHLETVQQDYASPTHLAYTLLLTMGLMCGTYGLLKIYVVVTADSYSVTRRKTV